MNFRDVELLSEYLDGRLNPSETQRLESRLSSDPNLSATLEDLRQTRSLLRRLPQRKAPRNFRLTAKMVGVRPPEPRAYPAFRFATGLAAFLFLASVALNALTPFASRHLATAPMAPAYGMGGGGGGYGGGGDGGTASAPPEALSAAPAATQAPLQAPFAALAPTGTAGATTTAEQATNQVMQTEDAARASGAAGTGPAEAQASKAAPVEPGSPLAANEPIPSALVLTLGVIMLVCGVAAWLLRLGSERRIRSKWNQE